LEACPFFCFAVGTGLVPGSASASAIPVLLINAAQGSAKPFTSLARFLFLSFFASLAVTVSIDFS